MQLQPVVMNALAQDPAFATAATREVSASTFGENANAPLIQLLERAHEICKAQDRRLADDMKAQRNSRSPTARLLGLLKLQYDLDDMQLTATMAKNVSTQIGQALNTLTQRN